jgi:hypothetical protein
MAGDSALAIRSLYNKLHSHALLWHVLGATW